MTSLVRLCCVAVLASACASEATDDAGPIDDCAVQADDTLICERSFPGCVFMPDSAVQFERCGHRWEYVVYGRADGCPELFYYPEGAFRSPEAWEAFVGACSRHD